MKSPTQWRRGEGSRSFALRPETDRGQIKEVETAEGRFILTADLGDGKSKDLEIDVPPDLKISLNGQTELAGQPVKLADLQVGDRIVVHHLGKDNGREATEMTVDRLVTAEGKIGEVKVDEAKNEARLTLNVGTDDKPQLVEFPVAPECEITINSRRLVNDQVLKPTDLKPGDAATVEHDSRIVKVTANRIVHDKGTIEQIEDAALDVALQGETKRRYTVAESCPITFNGQPAKLSDLHEGDTVEVTHLSIDGNNPEATSVTAERPVDRSRWAILIGVGKYDNPSITPPEYAVEDAKLLRDVLVSRYQMPFDQVLPLMDEGRAPWSRAFPIAWAASAPTAGWWFSLAAGATRATTARFIWH